MTVISSSGARCGSCGKRLTLNWEIMDVDVNDGRPMGEEAQYSCEAITECDNCGKQARVELEFWEYPVGCIEGEPEISSTEDEEPYTVDIEIPEIRFLDI